MAVQILLCFEGDPDTEFWEKRHDVCPWPTLPVEGNVYRFGTLDDELAGYETVDQIRYFDSGDVMIRVIPDALMTDWTKEMRVVGFTKCDDYF